MLGNTVRPADLAILDCLSCSDRNWAVLAEDLITEGVQVRHTLESIGMRTEVEDIMKKLEMSSDFFTEPMVHFRKRGQGHNGPLHGKSCSLVACGGVRKSVG